MNLFPGLNHNSYIFLFYNTLIFSLEYIKIEMENSMKSNSNPLFEIKLELSEDKILFSPTIEPNNDNNFQLLVHNLIDDIYKMGKHVPRVSEGVFFLNFTFLKFFFIQIRQRNCK